jgi:hypothetical protein
MPYLSWFTTRFFSTTLPRPPTTTMPSPHASLARPFVGASALLLSMTRLPTMCASRWGGRSSVSRELGTIPLVLRHSISVPTSTSTMSGANTSSYPNTCAWPFDASEESPRHAPAITPNSATAAMTSHGLHRLLNPLPTGGTLAGESTAHSPQLLSRSSCSCALSVCVLWIANRQRICVSSRRSLISDFRWI